MSAIEDIAAERRRQIEAEGWTAEHDDRHTDRSMARAAAVYAYWSSLTRAEKEAHANAFGGLALGMISFVVASWPWARRWFKPTTPRRDLVKAGALILAEIERLDRARDRILQEHAAERSKLDMDPAE